MGEEGRDLEKRPAQWADGRGKTTWPAFFSYLAELVTESWVNLARLSIFVLVLSVAAFALWKLHGIVW